MNKFSGMVDHLVVSICLMIFMCTIFTPTTNGQTTTSEYIRSVDINVDSIENCFGYKLLDCHHFYIYRSGINNKNKTVIRFDYGEKGQITNFELNYNSNYSLDSLEIANCILPYINLSPKTIKTRDKRLTEDKIMLIFNDEINDENEKQHCIMSLRKTKINTLDYLKEGRRLKNPDWVLNITKFNTLVNDDEAESIFSKLKNQSAKMLDDHLKYCEQDGTRLDNHEDLSKRINDCFQSILIEHFR